MMVPYKLLLLLGILTVPSALGQGSSSTLYPEEELYADLMRSYNKKIRPAPDTDDPVMVYMSMTLGRISELNEKQETLTVFGFLASTWIDPRLRWTPSRYSGITELVLPAEKIWLPEIILLNSVTQAVDLSFDSDFRVIIAHTGWVSWVPSYKLQSTCSPVLTRFPYDKQDCMLSFISWVHESEQQVLTNLTAAPVMDLYEINNEWSLVDTGIASGEITADEDAVPYVNVTITIQRNPEFFVWTVIVPSVLMSIVTVFVFWLPCESGEKIGLAITTLLGYTFVLLLVSDITPRTSKNIPIITYYIVIHMVLGALSMLATVCVLQVYHRSPTNPVPARLKTLAYTYIAALVCYPSEAGEEHGGGATKLNEDDDRKSIISTDGRSSSSTFTKDYRMVETVREWLESNGMGNRYSDLFNRLREKAKRAEKHGDNQADWRRVGNILDRLLMYSYIGVNVLTVVMYVVCARTDVITDMGH